MSSNRDDPPADGEAGGGGVDTHGHPETNVSPDDTDPDPETDSRLPVSRRALLTGAAVAGAGAAGAIALGGDGGTAGTTGTTGTVGDGSGSDGPQRQTTPVPADEARQLAEQFAPTLYFGRREQWFPTDPRPYTSQRDGETVVDGFDALEGYTAARAEEDAPNPTVFYHVVEYTDRLAVVQYWIYSAFDQFSVNFHWHDWELLQAFVDRESAEPVLYVASAHSRKVPNNEYLDPETTPAIISEVGSHSSALGMNASRDTFQRVSIDGLVPDVTNGVLAIASGEEGIPLAYGLPRDEGFRLPYVVPELDGAPLTDHPKLPSVAPEDLVPGDLTVRSFTDLTAPPTGLPPRELGPVFEPEPRRAEDADEHYALVPTTEVEDITAFTGPQLSFDFYVPRFVEDAVSSHITTTSTPWTQPRYRDPLVDVTDRTHRDAIRERFGVDSGSRGATVVGRVAELQPSADVDVGVTLTAPPVEAVALLESDPTAAPTFGGVAAFVDVEPGDHTLTVNGPGYAPYAQQVSVGRDTDGTTGETATETESATATETATEPTASAETGAETATDTLPGENPPGETVRVGTEGTIGLVPAADAVKLEVDASDRGGARRVRVDDDVAGRVFDAPPVETDGRAGLYVHRAGGYTVEVTDEQGKTSVERVNPGPNQNAAAVAKARTGVSGITRFLVEFLTETRETVERLLEQGTPEGGGGAERGRERERGSDEESVETAGSTTTGQTTSTASSESTTTPATDDTATIELTVVESREEGTPEDEEREGDAEESTETPSPTPTSEPTATPPADSTATPTSEPTTESTQRERSPREDLQQALDEAVSRAEAANEAALAGDVDATAEELRALRTVLVRLSSVTARAGAPQPAARIAARRAETADNRVGRALDALS